MIELIPDPPRDSYGPDEGGQAQARLRDVILQTAVEMDDIESLDEADSTTRVTSVEQCQCPPGYYGYSCQECDVGYWRYVLMKEYSALGRFLGFRAQNPFTYLGQNVIPRQFKSSM